MKIELHLHTNRHSPCSRNTPDEMMLQLAEEGYDGVFLTEHDILWDEEELMELRERHPGIRIWPGVERTFCHERGTCHLLILGATDPRFLEMTDPGDIFALARQNRHLTVLAHPFRWEGSNELIAQGFFPDAMEYRSYNHDAVQGQMSWVSANRLGIRLINAGDSHGLDAIGQFWIETTGPIEFPTDLYQAILQKRYENCSREDLIWAQPYWGGKISLRETQADENLDAG